MPAITTAPYAAPTDHEAKQAYLYGFEGLYNRPEINYPPEIKARVQAARLRKIKNNEKLFRTNIRLARKLVNSGKLGELTGPDKEYADVIRGFGKDSEVTKKQLKQIDDGMLRFLSDTALTEHHQKQPAKLDSRLKAKKYDAIIRNYPRYLRSFEASDCRWKKIPDIVDINLKELGGIYGVRPEYGYACETELIVSSKKSRQYDRPLDRRGYFIKSNEGQWLYYGVFTSVGVRPRRVGLHPLILKNPERAVRTLPFWEMDI